MAAGRWLMSLLLLATLTTAQDSIAMVGSSLIFGLHSMLETMYS